MYVYIRSEPTLWTVGFYDPDGKWVAESDHDNTMDAAERVAWLNGSKTIDPKRIAGTRIHRGQTRRFVCCVCHKNAVDAENGFDTCDECLSRQ